MAVSARPLDAPVRVCHVITGLGTGGAEMMLHKLVASLHPARFISSVVSLRDAGTVGPMLRRLRVPVDALGIRHPISPRAAVAVAGLGRRLRPMRPALLQGWMYHGNIAATVAASFGRLDVPVVWNIRQTVYRLGDNPVASRTAIRAGARLSGAAHAIIYNSRVSRSQHAALGYRDDHACVIPNGFDCDALAPRPDAAARLRALLGVPADAPIVAQVARYHPMKDHAGFLRAAALVREQHPAAHFVLIGPGVSETNAALASLIRAHDLGPAVHLLGERADASQLVSGADVLCSASAWGEGFPNVLGEAMAGAVPCVTTDVGDAAWIVGATGIVVPPSNPAALAGGLAAMLGASADARRSLGDAARRRVASEFSIGAVARQYENLYEQVLSTAPRAAPELAERSA